MIGGVSVNKIKKILHEYLCMDAITVCELSEKAGDFVWLEKNGYYVRETGEETKKGKAYTQKHNELMSKHLEKITDNSLNPTNLFELKKKLTNYIKNNHIKDVYEGLTESEVYAFRYVYYERW